MADDAFSPIATLSFPATSRIFRSSWCPDKDLLLTATRSPSGDKLSLWKMQGSKKWEFEFDKASTATGGIVDIAWSPDGTFIAVAHHPATITLHSVQDGAQHHIMFPRVKAGLPEKPKISGIWWIKRVDDAHESRKTPDLLRRNNLIPGSALSVLQSQPLLDTLYDETHAMSTSDLFSFQSTNPRNPPRYLTPQAVANWPSLPSDLPAATLRSKKVAKQKQRPGEELDEPDNTNYNTVLVVADQSGNMWTYLDGSFPLGFVSLGLTCSVSTLDTDRDDTFFVHPEVTDASLGDKSCVGLCPISVRIPWLSMSIPRDVAKVSTAVKDLTWFALCVIKEMKTAWYGSEAHSGAREWGAKWVAQLETRQKDQFGIKEPNAILDLTTLLVTGRASESLADFLGSGEQMSERGIQKWEAAILEALVRIRDYSEKLLIPATQRLYILMTEVRGWSQLTQYNSMHINVSEVLTLIILLTRGIVCASWLAAAARKEFARFIEFITWIRHETSKANQRTDAHNHPPPRHDILEVNEYLISGLVSSPIDKWFTGSTPSFQPNELGIKSPDSIKQAMAAVRDVLADPNGLGNIRIQSKDISNLDRNIDSLFTEFSTHCRRVFHLASHAPSRGAVVLHEAKLSPSLDSSNSANVFPVFTRHGLLTKKGATATQYLVLQSPHVHDQSYLCLIEIKVDTKVTPKIIAVGAAPLQCCIAREGEAVVRLEILDAEFFDDRTLIAVYRERDRPGPTYLCTVDTSDLSYEAIDASEDVKYNSREALMTDLVQRLEHGQLIARPLPIWERRALGGCREGRVTLAVNGREGRRVACVLDEGGLSLEILDMEGDGEEEDGEEGAEGGEGDGEGGEDSMDAGAD